MPGALQEAEAVTNLNQIMKSIILTPGPEAWSTFRKLCKARGWIYQTLANQRKIPKIGEATEINGETIQRVKIN
jgi:hypothetical protein